MLGDQLNLELANHSYPRVHPHKHRDHRTVISAQVGSCVHRCNLCIGMNVEPLISVCSSYPLGQFVTHLAKLQKINGASVFTAEAPLAVFTGECISEKYPCFSSCCRSCRRREKPPSLTPGLCRSSVQREIYCSTKSMLIENNPCFTCGQCKFHFLERLYCPFIYFPVSSLLSLALMRCSVRLPHKLKPFR